MHAFRRTVGCHQRTFLHRCYLGRDPMRNSGSKQEARNDWSCPYHRKDWWAFIRTLLSRCKRHPGKSLSFSAAVTALAFLFYLVYFYDLLDAHLNDEHEITIECIGRRYVLEHSTGEIFGIRTQSAHGGPEEALHDNMTLTILRVRNTGRSTINMGADNMPLSILFGPERVIAHKLIRNSSSDVQVSTEQVPPHDPSADFDLLHIWFDLLNGREFFDVYVLSDSPTIGHQFQFEFHAIGINAPTVIWDDCRTEA